MERTTPFSPQSAAEAFIPQFPPEASEGSNLLPVLSCQVDFGFEHYYLALENIIQHPEFNSTIILRADVLRDDIISRSDAPAAEMSGLKLVRRLRRRLLPRRPERDGSLDQDCSFYAADDPSTGAPQIHCVVLKPIMDDIPELPYYHPKVSAVGFWLRNSPHGSYILSVHVSPFLVSDMTYTEPNSRLYRICRSLGESVWKIGFGILAGYQKKVQHDRLIQKEEYQDFYLVMRERFKSVVNEWQLDTDPLKHVFEDIGIATFIILLWKNMYAKRESPPEANEDEQWHSWGRPPGGYVDLGCGNGLLVHILVSMGYDNGIGIDLRRRVSWDQYPPATRERLRIHAYDPTLTTETDPTPPMLALGSFIIGNHSDEMTPWLPILACLAHSDFLSIPCCAWNLDRPFTVPKGFHKRAMTPAEVNLRQQLEARGSGGSRSRYAAYLQWHFHQAVQYGFEPETDVLRIPSTKNWAIIGRHRQRDQPEDVTHIRRALETISKIRLEGSFRVRRPEGKAGHACPLI